MALIPSNNKFLVRKEVPRSASSSILAPDQSNSKEESHEGTIVAIPVQVFQPNMSIRNVGDRILFGKYAGTKVVVDGEDLHILDESDILGTFAN